MLAVRIWPEVIGALFLMQLPAWAAIGLWLWVRQESARKRADPGRCWHCGYNLTGNVSGVCPECGGVILPRGEPHHASHIRLTSSERTAIALFALSAVALTCIALVFLSDSSVESKAAATLMLAGAGVTGLRAAGRLLRHHLRRAS